jgi:hypothetical protein
MRRTLLGIGSIWSPLYLAFFVAVMTIAVVRGNGEPDDEFIVPFGLLFGLHLFTIILSMVLLVFFCVDAFNNPRVREDHRVMWLLLLVLGSVIAMPVYWWLHIRADPGPRRGP